MLALRVASRRTVALVGAVILTAGLLVAPVSARNTTATKFGNTHLQQRTAVATHRITGRQAARETKASSRKSSPARAPMARPARFEGTSPGKAQPATSGRKALIVSGPTLTSVHKFAGIDEAAADGTAPPDPWVAVNASYIVQSTNGQVRISDRAGNLKASIATWAMFSIWPGYADSDPRIVWDAYHNRWVGVIAWFDAPDFTDMGLTLIVSDTADPLGAWGTYTFGYGNSLPDFPAIASSSDKIVLAANEFTDAASYAGTSLLVIPWSSILAGTDVSGVWDIWDWLWNFRPGQVHGTSADLHLVAESDDTGNLLYARIKGSATSPTLEGFDLAIPNGSNVTQAPRQPSDPDGIANADDGRIPDAVWRSNQLSFSRTVEYARNGIDDDLAIEVVRLNTSSTATTAPTVGIDTVLDGTSGMDQFTSGVGTSGSGTTFVTYSESSASQPPAVMATAIHPTYGISPAITVATSDASYGGDRWGDFAGVAADPSGTDAVWQSHQTSDGSGGWRTEVSRLILDGVAPVAGAPNQTLVAGTTLGQWKSFPETVPVKVYWTGSDAGSGISRYVLDVADHGSDFGTAATTGATSTVRTHSWTPYNGTATAYQYRVTPTDDAGNTGTTILGSVLTPYVWQQTQYVTYSGTWTSSSSASYSGGSVKYSSKAGAYASFKTSGRSFGFVSTKASSRGKVKVYLDGTYKGTVTLTSSTTKYRNLAYVVGFPTSGTHTLKLVVYSGRVDIDAFVVLK